MISTTSVIGRRLDALPPGKFHIRMLCLIGAGMFFDGFDIYLAAGVLGALVREGVSNVDTNAWFISATFAGMTVGAWMAGVLGDRYGQALHLPVQPCAVWFWPPCSRPPSRRSITVAFRVPLRHGGRVGGGDRGRVRHDVRVHAACYPRPLCGPARRFHQLGSARCDVRGLSHHPLSRLALDVRDRGRRSRDRVADAQEHAGITTVAGVERALSGGSGPHHPPYRGRQRSACHPEEEPPSTADAVRGRPRWRLSPAVPAVDAYSKPSAAAPNLDRGS